ncbi:MAG: hypothetical protein ACKVUS_04390 [Saprospiraceae bacterium]
MVDEKQTPFGGISEGRFMLNVFFVERLNFYFLVRQNRIAAASEDRARTATTTSGELNCVRNHGANIEALIPDKQPRQIKFSFQAPRQCRSRAGLFFKIQISRRSICFAKFKPTRQKSVSQNLWEKSNQSSARIIFFVCDQFFCFAENPI